MEKVTNEQEFWAFMAKLTAERERREGEFRAEQEQREAEFRVEREQREAKFRSEFEERFAKIDAQMADTDLKIKALIEQTAKTDAQLAKTDAQLAKTDRQLAKTDAKLEKVATLLGNVNNNRGEVAEEFFFRSLEKKPQIADIHFDTVHRNWSSSKGKVFDEFDLLLVNGDVLALIEVKTKAHVELVNNMIHKKIPNFKLLFPHAKQYKLYAGIASLVTYPELIEAAQHAGLFLLTQQGKHLEVVDAPVHAF